MTTTSTVRPVPTRTVPAADLHRAPTGARRAGAVAEAAHVTRRTRRAHSAAPATGPARAAGLALVSALALTLPVAGLLDAVGPSPSTLDVAVSFLVVGGLEVVVGRGLYALARDRAHPAAYAALLSRVGHGALVAVAAALLASRGTAGVAAFRADWATALLVLAVHLVVAGVALWRARVTPRAVSATVAAGGAAALVVAAVTAGQDALLPVLVPLLVAEAVLAGTLLRCGLRRDRRLG